MAGQTQGQQPPASGQPAAPSSPSQDRLPNGTVAGVVIGVAVGVALLSVLVTFIIMRRTHNFENSKRHRNRKSAGGFESAPRRQYEDESETKGGLVTSTAIGANSLDKYLPQSADDKTIQTRSRTMLDQIEIYVENFYQDTPSPSAGVVEAAISAFDSPYLRRSLASTISQSRYSLFLIKHLLTQHVIASISIPPSSNHSLLPDDVVLLSNKIEAGRTNATSKPGFARCMSQWRVLTNFLRLDPSLDTAFVARRDRRINEIVEKFLQTFAPWANTRCANDERAKSLSDILKDAAGLGLFFFSQPSDLRFQWPGQEELGSNKIAISPALVKITDELGQPLTQPQVLVGAAVQKL